MRRRTMFGAVRGLTTKLMLRSLADPVVAPTSPPYHRPVDDGLRTLDAEACRAATADHLAVAARTYGDDLDRSLETVGRREPARLLSPGVTLGALLATGQDGRDDGGR